MPRRYRNPNLRWGAFWSSAFAALALFVNLVSGWGLGGFGVVVLAVTIAMAGFSTYRWWRISLAVDVDGVVVCNRRERATIPWSGIREFRYPYSGVYPPYSDRRRGRDVMVVDKVDGKTMPVQAVQPLGSSSPLVDYFLSRGRYRGPDRIAAALNDQLARHRASDE